MSCWSVLVVGDTQYLFDGERRRPDLLQATFDTAAAMVRDGRAAPIRHVIHVGDVTEHGSSAECAAALPILLAGQQLLDTSMTVVTGNHDIDQRTDDLRGPTPFLEAFGPTGLLGTLDEAGPGGYSSWRILDTGVGVLGLDWRPSAAGWAWADDVLERHPDVPAIVVSHDIAFDHALTAHGLDVDALAARHPQVFLILGGHEWPSTRAASRIECHAVCFQQLPFGGAGAARIYEFDTSRGECRVASICPGLQAPDVFRSPAARRQLALATADDQFTFPLPNALGGRDDPWQAAGMELLLDLRPEGVCEIDLPLPSASTIEVVATLDTLEHADWQVLLARLGQAPDGSAEPLAALSCSSERFLSWQAYVEGGQTWLTTHEVPVGATVTLVWSNAATPGLWVDGDPAGRVDAHHTNALAPGPWRWRIGAGSWDGKPADPFHGRIQRVRVWG